MSLERKTPLRRTPMSAKSSLQRTPRRPARPKNTGPSKTTRAIVWTRAGGRCEVCGSSLAGMLGFSVHHRRARGMGGTRRSETNTPSNLLVVCGSGTTGCHGHIESHREQSYAAGLLLHDGQAPADVPVLLADPSNPDRRRPVLLNDDGTYTEEPPA